MSHPHQATWGNEYRPDTQLSREGLLVPTRAQMAACCIERIPMSEVTPERAEQILEVTRHAQAHRESAELITGIRGLLDQMPAESDRANTVAIPSESMWAMRYHQLHRRLQRERLGGALMFALLGLAVLLMGCGLPQGPVGPGPQGSSGDEGSSGMAQGSGSGMVDESSGGSGSSSGAGSGSSSGSSSGGEPVCEVQGLECLCDGEVADPFECVDECLWVDAPPDCHCDGQTAPAEWCELAPCVLEGQGDDLECLCAGLPADHLLCVTECHMSGDTCLCGNEPAPIEWCEQ